MIDIVMVLRNPPFGTETSERTIMARAADEIERLRKVLESYACTCGGMSPDGVQSCWKQDKCGKEARAALEVK